MNIAERLTVDCLRAFVDPNRRTQSADPGERAYQLSVEVLRHFFGEQWLIKHLIKASDSTDFLRRDFSTRERQVKHGFRVVDLAEMLCNLQNIEGFDSCVAQMGHGQIESAYAELDIGKSLYAHEIAFRFVTPIGRKGADYDLDIFYPDGTMACADTKCKIETTAFSADSIKHSLGEARKQLPPDRPGIVFVKVPPHWIEEEQVRDSMIAAADTFLQGTQRVVSVKFYVSEIVFVDDKIAQLMRYREVSNPRNRFDTGRDWDIFSDREVPSGWNGMPPHWLRLLYFPDGEPKQG
jgi:hypothetical protein